MNENHAALRPLRALASAWAGTPCPEEDYQKKKEAYELKQQNKER